MLKRALLILATILFFVAKADALQLCKINVDPVEVYPPVADNELKLAIDQEYLVSMKGGTGRIYSECILKPGHKDHQGQDVFLIKKGNDFTKVWNCGNQIISIRSRHQSQPQLLVGLPVPAPAFFRPGTIRESFTTIIRLWNKNSITAILADIPGYEGRDKGGEVKAKCHNNATVNPPCKASGVHVFNVGFTNIAIPVNPIAVGVTDGEGAFTFPKESLRGAIICVHAPWAKPQMHYPVSGVSCTRAGELDQQMQRENTAAMHFVKN